MNKCNKKDVYKGHILFLLACISVVIMSVFDINNITVTGFNMRSLNSGKMYLNQLMDKSDIVFIAEHRLYSNELFKLNDVNQLYDVYAKASSDLDREHQNVRSGHCGVALFWKKDLSNAINTIECNSDRICAIEICGALYEKSLFVIGVYLPHQTCKISSFEAEISALSDLIARIQHKGEIVIVGDTNCHFGKEVGNRCWGKSTKNAKRLMKIVQACQLTIVDIDDEVCTGPNHTFHVDGVGTSYIDHCIVSKNVQGSIMECCVLDEDHLNMSDHLPVVLKISTCRLYSENVRINDCIMWHKLSETQIADMYTNPLGKRLDSLVHIISDPCVESDNVTEIIDKAYNKLVSEIHEAARALPRVDFKPHCKPYWNNQLSELAIANKKSWKEWVVGGRPRGNHQLYLKYKECKNNFKHAQRKAIKEYEQNNLDQVTNYQEMNLRYFWYLVYKTIWYIRLKLRMWANIL